MTMLPGALRAMLDTKTLVARPTDTAPIDGQTHSTRTFATPVEAQMRIDAIGGRRERLGEGVKHRATHLAFADDDADVRENDVLKALDGPYTGTTWNVLVTPDQVHGSHFQVALEKTDLVASEASQLV